MHFERSNGAVLEDIPGSNEHTIVEGWLVRILEVSVKATTITSSSAYWAAKIWCTCKEHGYKYRYLVMIRTCGFMYHVLRSIFAIFSRVFLFLNSKDAL